MAAVPLECVPAAHGAHALEDDAPPAPELGPGGQGVHSDPGDALKDPGAQGVHAVAPAGDEEPAGHAAHAPVPLAAAKLPAPQGSHVAEPSASAAYPGVHGAQAVLASVEAVGTGAVPTGHCVHAEGER